MTETKYEIATTCINRIKHVNKLLEWLYDMRNNGRGFMLMHTGIGVCPDRVVCESADYNVLILALEKDKKSLEESFAQL